LDVNLKEGNHKVSLYCVDWDSTVRRQRIEVIDYNHGTVLSTVYLSSFSGGQYLVWNVTGHVTIKITCTGGANGVVSGIFLDEVGTGPTIPPIAPVDSLPRLFPRTK
jgi:hypothetical protein